MKRSMQRFVLAGSVFALVVAGCGGDDDDDASSTSSAPSATEAAAGTTGADAPASTGGAATTSGGTAAATTTGEDSTGDVTTGGTLRLAIDGEAACYVPSACSVSYGPGAVRGAVLQNLVRPAANADGWELDMAESIEPSADFTEFTVTLKPDMVWSDGTPVTAGDIKTLFDTYVFGESSTIKGNVASITATEAPDDSTVVFTLAMSQAPFPALLTNIPIWKPTPGLTQTSLPVGTGPFMFESWEPNVLTKLVRNPHYGATDDAGTALPYLDGIDVTAVTSGDTRVNAIESGEVDLTMSTDPLVTSTLEGVADVHQLALNAGGGLFFNAASPPTDDVRVRQGLAWATNKDDILEAIGGGEPRDEYYVPDSPWYSPEASEATPGFDPEQAQTLLDEYINDPARSDGQPAGTPLDIDISHVQGAITQESIAVLAQQQWGDVGVTVSITPKDQSTLIGDAIAGNFNVNYFGWATPHPYSLLSRNYGPWPETPTNYTHFNSDELQALVGEMSLASDATAMDPLVQESNMIFAEGVPLIFLHSTTIGWAAAPTIATIELYPGNGVVDFSTVSLTG